MKNLNGILFVLAGTIGCGAYAAEKAEPTTPRTQALVEAIKNVRDRGPFYSERHVALLIQLTEVTAGQLENVKSELQLDIVNKQKLIAAIEADQKRIFEHS